MDHDNDGHVTYDELCHNLTDNRMVAFAARLDIDHESLPMIYSILTVNGTMPVDADTFVVGCIKLKGLAKSVDIVDVALAMNRLSGDLANMKVGLKTLHDGLERRLDKFSGTLRSVFPDSTSSSFDPFWRSQSNRATQSLKSSLEVSNFDGAEPWVKM